MGYDQQTVIKVVASVSRHNSPRDKEDDALVEELRQRLESIVHEDKYRQILAMAV